VSVQADGFDELARDLLLAADEITEEVRKVASKGAFNIKNDWRRRWTGLPHGTVRALPFAIDYDVVVSGSAVSAEIGPSKEKRQGPLANLLEYGSVNNAPIPGGAPALEKEKPNFEQYVEDVAVKVLERRGL
jgi:hypothetical protein